MDLSTFLDHYREAITRTVIETYPPLYDAAARQSATLDLRHLLRRPLGAQAEAIRATAFALGRFRGVNVVGEMGTGKSYIAIAAAYLAGHQRVLIVCPPHLVRKWQREVLQTIPGARVAIVRTLSELEGSRADSGALQVVVCSREQAKLGYRWVPAAVPRHPHEFGALARDEQGAVLRQLCCPACFAPLVDDEQVPLSWEELRAKRRRCPACEGPLWQADRTGPRRVPLADHVRRRLPGHFDLLIADEVHEYKARGSAQGQAAATLAAACGRTLTLTGTAFGGYSSTLFYLLWRFSPAVRAAFGYRDEAKWVSRYGIVERITKRDPEAYTADGRHSKRRSYLVRTIEKPGVSPAVLFHLLPNTVFLRLGDVARDLPPYTEGVVRIRPDSGLEPGVSQAAAYERLASDLRRAVLAALHDGSRRLLATYLQALLAYPDACTRGESVVDPRTGRVIAEAPALPADGRYPKERALVELVLRERTRGRRVLVYITHTERRDLSPRLAAILEREGVRVAVLKADTVPPDRREGWIAARAREQAEVLICHPRLVQTGLDLIDWPSVVWYQTEYSVYVLRQASRRAWRIGQRQPVEVTHLVYDGTLQAEALALVAAKMRSALMLEGELPEEGLAALDGDGSDVYLALARRLAEPGGGAVAHARSLEALFEAARHREVDADEPLVAHGWNDESAAIGEPVAVPSDPPPDAAPVDDLPSFAGSPKPAAAPSAPPLGTVVTVEALAPLLRRRKPRPKPVPAGQLTLFGS